MNVKEDLTGKKFGQWTVLEKVNSSKQGRSQYLCECACGKRHIVGGAPLRRGKSSKCKECAMRVMAKGARKAGTFSFRYNDCLSDVRDGVVV